MGLMISIKTLCCTESNNDIDDDEKILLIKQESILFHTDNLQNKLIRENSLDSNNSKGSSKTVVPIFN